MSNPTVGTADAPWPEIEPRLLHGNRPPPPAFPVERLPEAWRPWVEAQAHGLAGADYLAQGLLGAVAAVCGTRIVADVTSHWREPLVLWQALVGEPSTGKTPALVLARRLVEAVDPEAGSWTRLAQIDPSLDMLARRAKGRAAGVTLWCDDLAGWLADNSRSGDRRLALAGWAADAAHVPDRSDYMSMEVDRFPLCIVGTLQADRLTEFLNGDIDGIASRFLYAWPVPRIDVVLGGPCADGKAVCALLRRLAGVAGSQETPHPLPFLSGALERLQAIVPPLRAFMRDRDGLESAWIGKAPGVIVRLAGLLCLMDWAQQTNAQPPDGVEERHVEQAHAVWSGYFWPHAQAVFGSCGTTVADRRTRRVARWLRRMRPAAVSREEIRREALCQTVDADTAEDLIERLQRYGALRPVPAQGSAGGGPRKRRWAVNPELWAS